MGSMKRLSYRPMSIVSEFQVEIFSHIDTLILGEIDHLLRQIPIPEESFVRLPPHWLPRTPRLLLPLQCICQIPPIREPQACRLEALLDQGNEFLLNWMVKYIGASG